MRSSPKQRISCENLEFPAKFARSEKSKVARGTSVDSMHSGVHDGGHGNGTSGTSLLS